MSLLTAKHSHTESAALSIAANRASKVQMLRRAAVDTATAAHAPRLKRMAERNELSLYRDVLEHIAAGRTKDATRLADVALTAWPEWAA